MAKTSFFNPGLTVDIVLFTIEDDSLKTLLIKRTNSPFKGDYALPGGFLHHGETTHDAALRILKDKAGVKNVYIEQLYTFDEYGRDPRGPIFSVTYFALVSKDKIRVTESDSTQAPAFISVSSLPKLAFDHKKIIEYSKKRLVSKIQYTNLVFSLLPEAFTLSQLQKTYEIILEKKLDKRNFRKKFMQLDLVKKTNEKLRGGRQRPAELYTFISSKPEELKKFF